LIDLRLQSLFALLSLAIVGKQRACYAMFFPNDADRIALAVGYSGSNWVISR
jgi:hypothetical protein